MSRLKQLFIYGLLIVGFIIFSLIMEDALIKSTHKRISGEVNSTEEGSSSGVTIDNVVADASSSNGTIKFTVKNDTSDTEKEGYVKVDLYNDRGQKAITQYVKIDKLLPGESRDYELKFKGNNIKSYKLTYMDTIPDFSNKISIFGWEFDADDVFGFDLSNAKLFGRKITDIFSLEKAKVVTGNVLSYVLAFLRQIPPWGYLAAALVVIYYSPLIF